MEQGFQHGPESSLSSSDPQQLDTGEIDATSLGTIQPWTGEKATVFRFNQMYCISVGVRIMFRDFDGMMFKAMLTCK